MARRAGRARAGSGAFRTALLGGDGGWGSVQSQEDWERLQAETAEACESGEAILTMLGGTRFVEPERAALVHVLWRDFLATYQPKGPAEYMVIAMAVLSFDHFLRVNTMVHGLQTRLESEFFSLAPLQTEGSPDGRRTATDGLAAERLADQLQTGALPWLDRLNRMVIRNLRALRELKGGALSLTVANYCQLNLGQSQTNTAQVPPPDKTRSEQAARSLRRPRSKAGA